MFFFSLCYLKIVPNNVSKGANLKYLGFICPLEDYKLYAYTTNSMVKLIIAVEDVTIREDFVRNVSTTIVEYY
mgnify:CR=1 FL=1